MTQIIHAHASRTHIVFTLNLINLQEDPRVPPRVSHHTHELRSVSSQPRRAHKHRAHRFVWGDDDGGGVAVAFLLYPPLIDKNKHAFEQTRSYTHTNTQTPNLEDLSPDIYMLCMPPPSFRWNRLPGRACVNSRAAHCIIYLKMSYDLLRDV